VTAQDRDYGRLYGRLLKAAKTILDNYEGVGPVGDCRIYIWDVDELKAAYTELIDGVEEACPRCGAKTATGNGHRYCLNLSCDWAETTVSTWPNTWWTCPICLAVFDAVEGHMKAHARAHFGGSQEGFGVKA
jgi:hypothetical protein